MARVLIVYFSQTGSTKKVAEHIADGIRSEGHGVTTARLQDVTPGDASTFDVIGIGSPTYAFRLPFNVADWTQMLPSLNGKAAFGFLTYGTIPGRSEQDLFEALSATGAVNLGTMVTTGADYFIAYLKRGVLFQPDAPTEQELSRVDSFAKRVAKGIENREPAPQPTRRKLGLVYRMERFSMSRPFIRGVYTRAFRADPERCTSCNVCAQTCPKGNIGLNDGVPEWGRDCIACFLCEQNCPENAITSIADSWIFAPFMNWNVKTAKKKGHPWVPVRHAGGKTSVVET